MAPTVQHPIHKEPMASLLSHVQHDPSITRVIPLAALHGCSERLLKLGHHTRLVGVLNVTPDSFSDGGVHGTVESAIEVGKVACSCFVRRVFF